ncbi:MAG: CoA-binding protein [Cereibacter sphaeroides]|uniref:CoA-binding protein n=1 Tax=Cereibacter sphaeroides TaxID=1063 RepID=A0A2W5S9W2_CERSP|nr:MAG: CoA-binding protein [Cereibacter sphaeroides]
MSSDAESIEILSSVRTIAMVGWSPNPARPSHRVGQFLHANGYRVIPVNPGHAGAEALGERVRSSISEIAEHVDMLDIFRRSDAVLPAVEEAVQSLTGLKVVWMQLGVTNDRAAALAEGQGLRVVQDRCPLIEISRLNIPTPRTWA